MGGYIGVPGLPAITRKARCLLVSIFRLGAVRPIATRLRLAHEGRKWPTSSGKRLPLGQRSRVSDLVSFTIDEMALRVEMVVQTGMNREEFL